MLKMDRIGAKMYTLLFNVPTLIYLPSSQLRLIAYCFLYFNSRVFFSIYIKNYFLIRFLVRILLKYIY